MILYFIINPPQIQFCEALEVPQNFSRCNRGAESRETPKENGDVRVMRIKTKRSWLLANSLFSSELLVEIRGVEPLTFSMPLSVNNIEISTNYASFRTLVALCIYFLYTKPR